MTDHPWFKWRYFSPICAGLWARRVSFFKFAATNLKCAGSSLLKTNFSYNLMWCRSSFKSLKVGMLLFLLIFLHNPSSMPVFNRHYFSYRPKQREKKATYLIWFNLKWNVHEVSLRLLHMNNRKDSCFKHMAFWILRLKIPNKCQQILYIF